MSKKLLPKIAICGRPNVGKSSLFNRICKKRVSIVAEEEGVTRDFLIEEISFFEKSFYLIDTGGIGGRGIDFDRDIEEKANYVIELADLLVLVVDSQVGVQLSDIAIAKKILRSKKKVVLAVNKMDKPSEEKLSPFTSLGIKDIYPISCTHDLGIEDLLTGALSQVTTPTELPEEEKSIPVAIIGRPNVGKSTLMNHLLQEERSIASEIPGTTRDAIAHALKNSSVVLVDTAGIRRKKSEATVLEKFASVRTKEAIDKATICLVMIDCQEGLTVEDRKIIHMAEEEGKGIILLYNKWDAMKGERMEHHISSIYQKFPFLSQYPILCISAKSGRNLEKIVPAIEELDQEMNKQIATPELNKVIQEAMQRYTPPRIMGKRLRIYYGVQIGKAPPRFSLFVNHPKRMTRSYQKYLLHSLRKAFHFQGAPIFLHLKGKKV